VVDLEHAADQAIGPCGGDARQAVKALLVALFPIRKACPACGKPMVVVPDDAAEGATSVRIAAATAARHDGPQVGGRSAAASGEVSCATKMGTILSQWRYDAAARYAL
jgi:hypothetical protein